MTHASWLSLASALAISVLIGLCSYLPDGWTPDPPVVPTVTPAPTATWTPVSAALATAATLMLTASPTAGSDRDGRPRAAPGRRAGVEWRLR